MFNFKLLKRIQMLICVPTFIESLIYLQEVSITKFYGFRNFNVYTEPIICTCIMFQMLMNANLVDMYVTSHYVKRYFAMFQDVKYTSLINFKELCSEFGYHNAIIQ